MWRAIRHRSMAAALFAEDASGEWSAVNAVGGTVDMHDRDLNIFGRSTIAASIAEPVAHNA